MTEVLDGRKQKILRALIDDYIDTAEPVGSRTLARKYDLGVSPATIRNEMADLEMLGYLRHIHTSSGRIPSSLGYRFYVDGLQATPSVSAADREIIDRWYLKRVESIDGIFQETARLIAQMTQQVAFVLAPQAPQAAFRCLHFLPLDERRSIAVLMTDAGFVENKIVDMPSGSSFEDFRRIAQAFNYRLAGRTLREIEHNSSVKLQEEVGEDPLYETVLLIVRDGLAAKRSERLYLGGTSQLLAQPEFHDVERIKETLLLLEEEELIKDILHAHMGDGLKVKIGKEIASNRITDASLITATCRIDGEFLGAIAVLGPTRMKYSKAMSLLTYVNENLTQTIQRFRWQ